MSRDSRERVCLYEPLGSQDISSYLLTMSSENASHSAHMGGAVISFTSVYSVVHSI